MLRAGQSGAAREEAAEQSAARQTERSINRFASKRTFSLDLEGF